LNGLLVLAYLAFILFGYQNGTIYPLTAPLFGWLLSLGGSLSYHSFAEEREKRKIRAAFSKYVSAEVLPLILLENKNLLEGRKREATILFTDLEGFTKASEALPPERVIELLNIYFECMCPIVKEERGVLDKYVGDAIMAFWCEPFAGGKGPDHAVRTAFRMIEAIPKMQKMLVERGLPAVHMRIGVNTGEVVVGDIGSSERLDFTVIGKAVNAAARLESLNKDYKTRILISEDTYKQLKETYPLERLGPAELRGISESIVVYGYRPS
jgi:adenylate cyclase